MTPFTLLTQTNSLFNKNETSVRAPSLASVKGCHPENAQKVSIFMGPLHPIPTSPPQGTGPFKGKGGCAAVGKGLSASDRMNEERVSQQVREGLIERAW